MLVRDGKKKSGVGKLSYKVEENWAGRVENIKRIIKTWEKINLSIAGKVCIYKNIFNFTVCIYISCKHW